MMITSVDKRRSTGKDLCIVCRTRTGKSPDRAPLSIDAKVYQPLIDFLQLPPEFLIEEDVKCHIKRCQYPSFLKKSLMKGAEMREDILVLQKKFHDMHSKKNALPAAISEPINLNLVCATAACLDKAKMKLSELSNTSYTFTFLPFEALQ